VPLRTFRDFLLFHTAEGNVTRQEAASMIPPLLLDVQPHHRALDLCAAPGSKTSQVMEALQLQQQTHTDTGNNSQPARGLVVANDANEKRGYLLVHQLQRLGLTDTVVTCHLGQQFPGLYSRTGASNSVVLKATDVFDRIICDVPCSGDGTIRKNRNLWRQWGPGGALTLHNTQLELALRAAELLRGDGLMVYSTCSFNPIENEAVVSELLRRAGGSLELVDCSDKLPGLITRPGMSDWQVAWQPSKKSKKKGSNGDGEPPSLADSLVWFGDYDAVPEQLRGFRVVKSMFPSTQSEVRDQIRRCMRIFPTDQNTGGFFVALIRKVNGTSNENGSKQCWLESFEEVAAQTLPVRESYVCDLCGHQTHTIRNCPMSRNVQRRQENQEKRQRELEQIRGDQECENRLHTYTKLRSEHWDAIKQFYGVDNAFPHVSGIAGRDGSMPEN
jgi:tRNA (cytosine34-C5)-methyltransferase